MLQSEELEYRILQFVKRQDSSGWASTILGQLTSFIEWSNTAEVVDALKRLNKNDYLKLRKYGHIGGFEYSENDDDNEFFYTNGFELGFAPDGRPYFERLEESKSGDRRSMPIVNRPNTSNSPATRIAESWSIIHPSIVSISKKKCDDGHYADAVETALKEINKRVKDQVKFKTGKEFDGADLMCNAFSVKNPVIVLDDLTTESGRNIQLGYMQIFAGAMTGIRNPKAHENITISEARALHFLFLSSLLMYKLDEAKIENNVRT